MWSDLRYFCRSVLRAPQSIALSLLNLGLAVGLTTAVYALVDATILRPLPNVDLDGVVLLGGLAVPPGEDAVAFWSQAPSLERLATYHTGTVLQGSGEEAEGLRAARVSAQFFAVLGVPAMQGRLPTAAEEVAGRQHVAVISGRYWRNHYPVDSRVLGTEIVLNGTPHTIIGVLPDSFSFPAGTQVWVPRVRDRGEGNLDLFAASTNFDPNPFGSGWIGRLRPGRTVAGARAELYTLLRQLHDKYTAKTGLRFGDMVGISPLRDALARRSRSSLQLLFGGSLFLLALAAANSSAVLLGRGALRAKEIAVRLALGSSPRRIVRQALTEVALLGLLAGLLGWVIAVVSLQLASPLLHQYVPFEEGLVVSGRVLLFCLGLSTGTGLLAGLLPAWQALSPQCLQPLSDHQPQTSARGVRQLLVTAQVGLAFVLAAGAGLCVRSFLALTDVQPGYQPEGLLALRISMPQGQATLAQFLAREQAVREELRQLPGVAAVGAMGRAPFDPQSRGFLFVQRAGQTASLEYSPVSAGALGALGVPLVAGRHFTNADAGVAVISETAARRLWPGQNPVGQQLLVEGEKQARLVVGIVRDLRSGDLTARPEPQLYVPLHDPYRGKLAELSVTVLVRCAVDCGGVASSVRERASALTGRPAVLSSAAEALRSTLAPARLQALTLSTYAALGLLLALLGVSTLVAYLAAARTYEMGVRMTLGATAGDIVTLVAGEGLVYALAGLAGGVAAAVALAETTRSVLFGVSPLDARTFLLAGALLTLGVLMAALLPALAAARLDPRSAMQQR